MFLAKVGVASSSLVFRSQNKKAVRNSNGFFVCVYSDVIGNPGVSGHFGGQGENHFVPF